MVDPLEFCGECVVGLEVAERHGLSEEGALDSAGAECDADAGDAQHGEPE